MKANDTERRDKPVLAAILSEAGQSALKLGMLLALCRRPGVLLGGITVTGEDIEAALKIIEDERNANTPLYNMLGQGDWERTLQRVNDFIREKKKTSRVEVQQALGYYVQTARNMRSEERRVGTEER